MTKPLMAARRAAEIHHMIVTLRDRDDKLCSDAANTIAETEAELARLRVLCGEGGKVIGKLRSAVHERDQLLSRVADVLRRYSTFAGFEDLAALLKELEP